MTEQTLPEDLSSKNKWAAITDMTAAIVASMTDEPEAWTFTEDRATHRSGVIVAIDGSNIISPPIADVSVRSMNNITGAIVTAKAKQATLSLTTKVLIKDDATKVRDEAFSKEVSRVLSEH